MPSHMANTQSSSSVSDKVKSIVSFHATFFPDQIWLPLDMLNFYRRYLPEIAQILLQLTVILVGKDKPKNHLITIIHVASCAFAKSKEILVDAGQLVHSRPDTRLRLLSDASNDDVVYRSSPGCRWDNSDIRFICHEAVRSSLLSMLMKFFDWVVHDNAFMFADDIQVVYSFKDSLLSVIEAKMNWDLSSISNFGEISLLQLILY